MRVGVYIDGFNLYYGGRTVCGRGTAGWRWLDVRSLAESLLTPRWRALGASIERVVYCTARIDDQLGSSSARDQEIYLRVLRESGACDEIVFGSFVSRVKRAPLAVGDGKRRPSLVSEVPASVLDGCPGITRTSSGTIFASYAHREEKGSDVNVATHLLIDVLQREVDAIVLVSNDSDLELPVREARSRVPVGTVNPSTNYLAGKLRGSAGDGVGNHWWRQLNPADFEAHQFPGDVGGVSRPKGW